MGKQTFNDVPFGDLVTVRTYTDSPVALVMIAEVILNRYDRSDPVINQHEATERAVVIQREIRKKRERRRKRGRRQMVHLRGGHSDPQRTACGHLVEKVKTNNRRKGTVGVTCGNCLSIVKPKPEYVPLRKRRPDLNKKWDGVKTNKIA